MEVDRLGIGVLSTDECLRMLGSTVVGRLAISIAGHPDIFPINYILDRGDVVFRTAEGTKLAAAVLGAGVAFEIDGFDAESGDAWSVLVKGRAVEIEHRRELHDALALPLFPWHAAPKHHFVRIEADEISGRWFRVVDRTAWPDPFRDVPRTAME
jgi:nitroimidazol reductase NimA-like FMN-containing flavoprotein (pyridoxamine 5'-phosphate oxidase superfamily)